MRSPSEMDILQIDITNRCFLSCSNCTRLIPHQTKKWDMNHTTFTVAVESLLPWLQQGKVIGLIAGEPTLHPDFDEIASLLRHITGRTPLKNGRLPIADFNAFAMERLFDRSNGLGLWTSFGAGFYKHYERIMETFSNFNPNDHQAGGLHQALLIHRDDYCAKTGMKSDEWEENRSRCWVQNSWSASINDKGAYFCEVAASIDRLLYDGKHAWPVTSDWWQRQPHDFNDQIHLCNHCSLAQPGPATTDRLEFDTISKKNVVALEMVKSPAIKRPGGFNMWENLDSVEQRIVSTKDSYAGEFRVSPENSSMKPKKLTGIITCVGRADDLKKTLEHNAKLVDEIVVVTTRDDRATQLAFLEFGGLNEQYLDDQPTDQNWVKIDKDRNIFAMLAFADAHKGDAAFNKGAMLNAGLTAIKNPDWIVLTDADCYLNPKLPEFMKKHALNPGVLYGTYRREITNNPGQDNEIAEYTDDQNRQGWHDAATNLLPIGVNKEPNGYFQLFHWNARSFKAVDQTMSENFCSAGGIDTWFLQRFPPDKQCMIPELSVVHLGELKEEIGHDWNGNRPGPQWRQLGVITHEGMYRVEQGNIPDKFRVRLTSTMDGSQTELDHFVNGNPFPKDVVHGEHGKIIFCGKDQGQCHVHVSWFREQ